MPFYGFIFKSYRQQPHFQQTLLKVFTTPTIITVVLRKRTLVMPKTKVDRSRLVSRQC